MINLKMIGYVILVALFVIPGCNIYTKSKSESSVGPKRIVQDVYAQDSKRIQIMGEYTYIYGDNMDLFEAKEICYTLALRNAIENSDVFITSTTSIKDDKMIQALVRAISFGHVQDISVVEEKIDGREIFYKLTGYINPVEIQNVLRGDTKGNQIKSVTSLIDKQDTAVEINKYSAPAKDILGNINYYCAERRETLKMVRQEILQQKESYKENLYYTLQRFDSLFVEFQYLIEQEYGAVNAAGQDYADIYCELELMFNISFDLYKDLFKEFADTLDTAIKNELINDIKGHADKQMIGYMVSYADRMRRLNNKKKNLNTYYQAKFDSTDNDNYDHAIFMIYDIFYHCYSYISFVLDDAFQLKEHYGIEGKWTNQLMIRLLDSDPFYYFPDLKYDSIEITSDGTWLYSTNYDEGFTMENFDDSSWNEVEIVKNDTNQFSEIGINPPAIWIKSESKNRSLNNQSKLDTSSTKAYFRKSIVLPENIVYGDIYITADDDFILYLNDEYIMDDLDDDFFTVDTLDYYTISYLLKPGKNIISLQVDDFDNSGAGIKLFGNFKYINQNALKKERSKYLD